MATITDHKFVPGSGRTAHLCAHERYEADAGGGGLVECLKLDGEHVPAPRPLEVEPGALERFAIHHPKSVAGMTRAGDAMLEGMKSALKAKPPAPELTMDDLRSVDAFREWMVAKLHENRHKGNRAAWIDHEEFPIELAQARLLEEVAELFMALADPDSSRADRIIRECADVANLVMMIADKTGELRTLDPWTRRPK